uniref:Uncharacterized protein n=1 Tax=Picea sitchensis TaxID=3332 RepID=A9NR07_PICSI|nr:unknown [Picea sitchensis]
MKALLMSRSSLIRGKIRIRMEPVVSLGKKGNLRRRVMEEKRSQNPSRDPRLEEFQNQVERVKVLGAIEVTQK